MLTLVVPLSEPTRDRFEKLCFLIGESLDPSIEIVFLYREFLAYAPAILAQTLASLSEKGVGRKVKFQTTFEAALRSTSSEWIWVAPFLPEKSETLEGAAIDLIELLDEEDLHCAITFSRWFEFAGFAWHQSLCLPRSVWPMLELETITPSLGQALGIFVKLKELGVPLVSAGGLGAKLSTALFEELRSTQTQDLKSLGSGLLDWARTTYDRWRS